MVGDWTGTGKDTVGLYNPTTSMFYLRNSNSSGFSDMAFTYGPAQSGWKPLVGDWTGTGKDTVGLYNPTTSTFYLRNSNTTGFSDMAFVYGPANAGLIPLIGTWTFPGEAEMAAAQVTAPQNVPALAQTDLQPIVNRAIALWSQAGLDAASAQKLQQAQFVISDLPGTYLGETEGNVIYLDTNAAGNGWFVDPTPASNEEIYAVRKRPAVASRGPAGLESDRPIDRRGARTRAYRRPGRSECRVGRPDERRARRRRPPRSLAPGCRRRSPRVLVTDQHPRVANRPAPLLCCCLINSIELWGSRNTTISDVFLFTVAWGR